MVIKTAILSILLAASASALSVPPNVQTFYNNVKGGGCHSFVGGQTNLGDGQGNKGWGYCTDAANMVYLSSKNSLGDMDVDCDGKHGCGGSTDLGGTSFDDILSSKGYGIKTLDAGIHAFSVLGTCHVNLDATSGGGPLNPLALVAVVCNNQIFYSVWGDTNGCDNPQQATGEASISLAKTCFPKEGLNANKGHVAHDVLYMAFTGADAVVGPKDANWKANNPADFQASLKAFGDKILAKKFGGSAPGSGNPPPPPPPPQTCTWIGHCAGAACSTHDDCDGTLACLNGKCTAS